MPDTLEIPVTLATLASWATRSCPPPTSSCTTSSWTKPGSCASQLPTSMETTIASTPARRLDANSDILLPQQVSDQTSSFSCFCPKFLQQFQNPYLANGGLQYNPYIGVQLQQLYNQQLQQARVLQQQQAFPNQYLYQNMYGKKWSKKNFIISMLKVKWKGFFLNNTRLLHKFSIGMKGNLRLIQFREPKVESNHSFCNLSIKDHIRLVDVRSLCVLLSIEHHRGINCHWIFTAQTTQTIKSQWPKIYTHKNIESRLRYE